MQSTSQTDVDATRPAPPHRVVVLFLVLSLITTGCGLVGPEDAEDTTPPEVPSDLSAESQDSAIALH